MFSLKELLNTETVKNLFSLRDRLREVGRKMAALKKAYRSWLRGLATETSKRRIAFWKALANDWLKHRRRQIAALSVWYPSQTAELQFLE